MTKQQITQLTEARKLIRLAQETVQTTDNGMGLYARLDEVMYSIDDLIEDITSDLEAA